MQVQASDCYRNSSSSSSSSNSTQIRQTPTPFDHLRKRISFIVLMLFQFVDYKTRVRMGCLNRISRKAWKSLGTGHTAQEYQANLETFLCSIREHCLFQAHILNLARGIDKVLDILHIDDSKIKDEFPYKLQKLCKKADFPEWLVQDESYPDISRVDQQAAGIICLTFPFETITSANPDLLPTIFQAPFSVAQTVVKGMAEHNEEEKAAEMQTFSWKDEEKIKFQKLSRLWNQEVTVPVLLLMDIHECDEVEKAFLKTLVSDAIYRGNLYQLYELTLAPAARMGNWLYATQISMPKSTEQARLFREILAGKKISAPFDDYSIIQNLLLDRWNDPECTIYIYRILSLREEKNRLLPFSQKIDRSIQYTQESLIVDGLYRGDIGPLRQFTQTAFCRRHGRTLDFRDSLRQALPQDAQEDGWFRDNLTGRKIPVSYSDLDFVKQHVLQNRDNAKYVSCAYKISFMLVKGNIKILKRFRKEVGDALEEQHAPSYDFDFPRKSIYALFNS